MQLSLPGDNSQHPLLPTPTCVPDHALICPIGRGSYGDVWLARNVMGTPRAVKIVYRARFSSERPYEREWEGIREFEPVSRSHEGLVNILQMGQAEDGSSFYYIMELADDAKFGHRFRFLDQSVGAGEHSRKDAPDESHGQTEADHTPVMLPERYAAKTLRSELRKQDGQMPINECLRIGAALSSALHHLHEKGLVHRDIKPANIIFVNGIPKLADIGLVAKLGDQGSFVGTEEFIPPEGPGSPQADVFSLGRVLYEMASGNRAEQWPNPAKRELDDPDLDRFVELDRVIDKACAPDSRLRYSSADELRKDLNKVELGKSVRVPHWVGKHWQRVKFGVLIGAAVGLGMIGVLSGVVLSVRARAKAAEEREAEQRRQSIMQRMVMTRLNARAAGWSSDVRRMANEAAEIRRDEELRDQVAASLEGMDASVAKVFTNFASEGVAFDQTGNRLALVGGSGTNVNLLWDFSAERGQTMQWFGPGPVAFEENGTLTQFFRQRNRFLLWDLANAKPTKEFQLPVPKRAEPYFLVSSHAKAITRDGRLVAVAASFSNAPTTIAVWDTASGKPLGSFTNDAVQRLALSDDGSFVAAGGPNGRIFVWSVKTANRIGPLQADEAGIESLCFSRDVRRFASATNDLTQWLLAAGDAGGTVTIWRVPEGAFRRQCIGSPHQILEVAFGPDGMTLASGGRYGVKLWDVATGKLLLNLGGIDALTGLAFSPDGTKLAASSQTMFAPGRVVVWDIEFGRGIRALRGLAARISKVHLAANGRWVAALADNWEVGIWDAQRSQLRHVLKVPRGVLSDNAALAFSPDGERFAFCSGSEATLWDMHSGRVAKSWKLPLALLDTLVFPDSDKLLLIRLETVSGQVGPFTHYPPAQYPRLVRVRNLLGEKPTEPLAEVREINEHATGIVAASDGSCFAAASVHKLNGPKRVVVGAFETATGRPLWSVPSTNGTSTLVCDAVSKILSFSADDSGQTTLWDLASGTKRGTLRPTPAALWRAAEHECARVSRIGGRGWRLFVGTNGAPVVAFGTDGDSTGVPEFNRQGNFLAWGNADGTVCVAALEEIRNQIAELGWGW